MAGLVEKLSSLDAGNDPPLPAEIEERHQAKLDGYAVQFVGPVLVIAGNMLNGVSGLFA